MQPIVRVRDLSHTYGTQRVLDRLSFDVPEDQTVALLGPNGAGKTTLVRILSTLLVPSAGQATICGLDVAREPAKVRSVISLTGQSAAVDEYLTGEENLRLVARLWRIPPREARTRAHDLLDRFDLATAASKPVRLYSGGMRRKLDLALSLIVRPRVLFLDEPTTGLDPRSRLALWEIVEELNASGVTVLLTTQYLEEADRLANSIVMIAHGRVVAEGSPSRLKRDIAGPQVILHFADEALRQLACGVLGAKAVAFPGSPAGLAIDAGARSVRDVLNDLERAGIPVERISLHEPTLDDVFLTLTSATPERGKAA